MDHDYIEVLDLEIPFEKCFEMVPNEYFLYFYLPNCGHCTKIQNFVIAFALSKTIPLYFIRFENSIPISDDVSSTIGANSIEQLMILGVPSLVNIRDKTVHFNIAGSNEIVKMLEQYISL